MGQVRTAELELGGPRAFPVIVCVAWTAELELGGPRVGRPRISDTPRGDDPHVRPRSRGRDLGTHR
jgi:hypothetical protein